MEKSGNLSREIAPSSPDAARAPRPRQSAAHKQHPARRPIARLLVSTTRALTRVHHRDSVRRARDEEGAIVRIRRIRSTGAQGTKSSGRIEATVECVEQIRD